MRRMTVLSRQKSKAKGRGAVTVRPRRGPEGRLARLLARVGALRAGTVALSVGLVFCLSLLWYSGWFGRQIDRLVAAAYQATADAGFAVQEVLVEGRNRTDGEAILTVLSVARGTAILAVDPEAARRRLEDLPWVRAAAVERRLPNLLYVRLAEREPLALWQMDGRLAVIDREGTVIPGATAKLFPGLPLVVGPDAPQSAAALLAMLDSAPALRSRVTAAVRVSGRRWNLRLEGGIEVRLPEDGAERAWAQLVVLEKEQNLLSRDVVAIDLRMPGRPVVRLTPGAAPHRDRGKAGQNT